MKKFLQTLSEKLKLGPKGLIFLTWVVALLGLATAAVLAYMAFFG